MAHKAVGEIEARSWFRAHPDAKARLEKTFSRFTITTWTSRNTMSEAARVVYHADDQTYWYITNDGVASLTEEHANSPRH